MNLRLTSIEIISLLENLVLSIIPFANNKGINVIFDTEEEIVMSVDPDKIERMVLNLLSNAIKFSKNIGIIKAILSRKNDTLYFSIEDNGVCISKENSDKIFARFSQIEDTMVIKNEGSGIGLSLVKSFVFLHGGNVDVDSVLWVSTTSIVELPNKVLSGKKVYTYSMEDNIGDMLRTNIELLDIYL